MAHTLPAAGEDPRPLREGWGCLQLPGQQKGCSDGCELYLQEAALGELPAGSTVAVRAGAGQREGAVSWCRGCPGHILCGSPISGGGELLHGMGTAKGPGPRGSQPQRGLVERHGQDYWDCLPASCHLLWFD